MKAAACDDSAALTVGEFSDCVKLKLFLSAPTDGATKLKCVWCSFMESETVHSNMLVHKTFQNISSYTLIWTETSEAFFSPVITPSFITRISPRDEMFFSG